MTRRHQRSFTLCLQADASNPNTCPQKLTSNDLMDLMRNHNEASWFDNTDFDKLDVGAGPGHSPYRRRPLMWTSSGAKYVNERTVSTQQTAWALVACARYIPTTS
jgi:dipeptidase